MEGDKLKKIRRFYELEREWHDIRERSIWFSKSKNQKKYPLTFCSFMSILENIMNEQKLLASELWPSGEWD